MKPNDGQCKKYSEDERAEKLKQLEAILEEATLYQTKPFLNS